jgi:endonuclease YncB( thermonuclease family)
MRDVIRAEIDRINPTDDAHRALELIVESSVRPSEVDGELKLTVIDQNGQPRTRETNGQQTDLTLHDLLDELRVRYPVLFKPSKTEAVPADGSEVPPQKREKPQRDWLNLVPGEHNDEIRPAEASVEPPAPRKQSGRLRIHEWSQNALKGWRGSAMTQPSTNPGLVRDPAPAATDKVRPVVDDKTRSPMRPSFAIAAVALLALLGVGAFLFRDDGDTPQQTSAAAPASSETAATTHIPDPGPSETGSTKSGPLRGVPDVIDTATLSLQGEVVRLFGVEWAPGGGKPEELTSYLQGREVTCEPTGKTDTYRCQVGGQDLSRVVLFNGGGQPTPDATPELKAAADKAREAKLGVWNKSQ